MRQQQSYCVSMGKRKERNGIERICEYTYVYIYIKFISDESCWFSWFICSTSTLSIEFGVIISALSKIRITSTEHYMCTVTISYRFASSFSYRFGSYILFSHIFFYFFVAFFVLIWFLLRSHFSSMQSLWFCIKQQIISIYKRNDRILLSLFFHSTGSHNLCIFPAFFLLSANLSFSLSFSMEHEIGK